MAVTVLGKTFETEDDRREYFRNELRRMLPELKKLEGFPIGEDYDIIALSDPPFFTACPNPWLNELVTTWEKEKSLLSNRIDEFEVEGPFASDIKEGRSNPIYKAHTYATKVPHPAVMRYILHYTQPGDIVFDGFAGTGMTGVAAQCCGNPDPEIKFKIEREFEILGFNQPIWGERKSICNDLSPLATFISSNFNLPNQLEEFSNELDQIRQKVHDECSWMYKTKHSNGLFGEINYMVWSEVFLCPECGSDIIFWESFIDELNGEMKEEVPCPHCSSSLSKKNLVKNEITSFDNELDSLARVTKYSPVLIHYHYNGKTFLKKPDSFDLELIEKIKNTQVIDPIPLHAFPSGEKTVEPIRKGIQHVNQVFSKRNLISLAAVKKESNRKTLILLTSMLNRSSKLVKTLISNYLSQLKGKTVGGWAGTPLDGTLYIPSITSEVSVIKSMNSRSASLKRMNITKNRFVEYGSHVTSTGTATKVNIKDNCADYIFTDPPFGSNRMYSELNFISEAWLGVMTNNKKEAIQNKVQHKSFSDYVHLMTAAFKEYYRILKPGKWMTVEFSNTSAAVWNGIQTSIQNAGFIIANVSSLSKKQGSFNSVNNKTSVKQDLIISCYKPSSTFDQRFEKNQYNNIGVWDFVEEHLKHLPVHLVKDNSTTAIIERSPKILFDRLVAFYVQRSLLVPIDAGKFQVGLKEHFVERDGMYFTNEQVAEYDRKKAEAPNFIQASLFVATEQDGVLFLKNLLEKKPLTYQEIHPHWMQALAGQRKGDIIPELADILQENFLNNDNGQWYAPDPENEADLEALRNKRLLKQFNQYLEVARQSKGKLKEARVEALRTGFKQSYKNKDFKTIIEIAECLERSRRSNLIMEDEVLLQFYDIASTRV